LVLSLLTACPPGPLERENEKTTPLAATVTPGASSSTPSDPGAVTRGSLLPMM
jgi:hypothetical protein